MKLKQKINRIAKFIAVNTILVGVLSIGMSVGFVAAPVSADQTTAESALREYCANQSNFDESMQMNPDPDACVSRGCDNSGWVWADGKRAGCESLRSAYLSCGTNPDGVGCNPSGSGGTDSTDSEAGDEKKEEKCEDLKTSILDMDSLCAEGGEGGAIFGLLKWILRIMTAGVGIMAVGGVAWGAFLYTTAENKPEQTKKAIGIITNVVIGIAAYAMMYVLLNYLIPGGIFS